jgi:hypothetical protein
MCETLETINGRFWLLHEYQHCLVTTFALCGLRLFRSVQSRWKYATVTITISLYCGEIRTAEHCSRQTKPVASETSVLAYISSKHNLLCRVRPRFTMAFH